MWRDTEPGFKITFWIAFLSTWTGAVAHWGLPLGVGFGWIPAFAAGFIAGTLWPVCALLACVGAIALVVVLGTELPTLERMGDAWLMPGMCGVLALLVAAPSLAEWWTASRSARRKREAK